MCADVHDYVRPLRYESVYIVYLSLCKGDEIYCFRQTKEKATEIYQIFLRQMLS